MVTGNWYIVAFAAPADPPWTPPNPQTPGAVLDAITGATQMLVFCVDDAVGTRYKIAWYGGEGLIPQGAETVIATPTKLVETSGNGETLTYVKDGTELLWYGDQTGRVDKIANPAALKAFI